MTAPDFRLLAAQHRYGLPSDWQWRQIASMPSIDGSFIVLYGAPQIGTYKNGPHKGQPKFPPKASCRQVIITHRDIADARARWEVETGLCSHCGGSGQEVASFCATNGGTTYQTCRACSGTGKPVQISPI